MRKRLYGFLGVVVLAVAIYYPYSPGGHQAINMRAAADHIPILAEKLHRDPRFTDVHLETFTGQEGSLGVFGTVADEAALADLRRIVLESAPPAPIAFRVRLPFVNDPTPATRPQG